ncbi:hypothetical protein DH2020_003160 [Rehmannia glutinosa]|uniref:ABC transporter domain-containing protein n=1 Tax=Rehmannia glutinosa TaxID=99300 RepID=A0ABR0XKT5_REHGL
MVEVDNPRPTVEINKLKFTYPGIDGHPPPGSTPLIDDFSSHSSPETAISSSAPMALVPLALSLFWKTTILKIIGGKHMVEQNMVRVFGRSAFHDTALTASGDLSYLGGEWRREVAFAGFEVPIQMDVSAEKMIYGVAGIDPQRRDELIKMRNGSLVWEEDTAKPFSNILDHIVHFLLRMYWILLWLIVWNLDATKDSNKSNSGNDQTLPVLGIDLSWRMHKVSDGQRRRVQICMGLLKPFKVLLLDEITVDLDVLARADLLRFLKKECSERGSTIIYATHIFDGLEDWPSHIVYVARGKLQLAMPMNKIKEISNLSLMNGRELLRKERDEERKIRKERKAGGLPDYEKQVDGSRVTGDPARAAVRVLNNGWAAGRLNSTIAGEENFILSSNRVLR